MTPIGKYPLGDAVSQETLDQEANLLESVSALPIHERLGVYLNLGGPGFLGAALTLGAGTLTASMLAGATFGYKTLWVIVLTMAFGVFMMAAMARFTCQGGFSLIEVQKRKHGKLIACVMTSFIGVVAVALIFNFGQYALGTHLIETIAELSGFEFPQKYNWLLYMGITSWLVLSYGKGGSGTRYVETFMKLALGLMFLCFALTLFVVGIDWGSAIHGLFVPWLPSGQGGIDLFIATTAAGVGVMDWLLFHYAGLTKGWGSKHEGLARMDIGLGLALPFIIINILVVCVFAGTLYGADQIPQSAAALSKALMPLLGEGGSQIVFLLGFLAVPITTTVGMSIAASIAFHEAMGWKPDVNSMRWKAVILMPQIAFLAAWYPSPIELIIILAAFLSLSNNIVGWSFYLLFNDKDVLGEKRPKSFFWNAGLLVQITLLNLVAISYVYNRLGWW
ncbi:MAG: NRAMP family divalent metal transporter [Sphingomonadales bacterium]